MNATEIEKMQQKLLDLRIELQDMELAFKENSNPVELDQSKVGRVSRMDAMQMQKMAQEVSRRRQEQLLKIEAALSRIETDEYGYCLLCDEEIIAGRLAIDPTSTLCVPCAEKR